MPGIELCRRFYGDVVRPILDGAFGSPPHAAALIGPGSEVLGFDTAMSTDHDWAPRVLLFLPAAHAALAPAIRGALEAALPERFAGHPVRISDDAGSPPAHRVAVTTVRAYVLERLAYDVDAPLEPVDWLTFPAQGLLELTAGAVYHDGTGELTALRECLAYYPHDVWLYLLASGWRRIAQEEHLMPRAGYAGDELGSALIGSRLVRDVMSLCFLMERRYAPYPKWFGTAFRELRAAAELSPLLRAAELARTWPEREGALTAAYVALARMHNALGITEPLAPQASPFYTRPFRVIWGDRFAEAIVARIADPAVGRIARRGLIGGIDQFTDSTDLRSPHWRATLRRLYTDEG